jgi:ABC-type Fe3+ transport system substrate-binding protein
MPKELEKELVVYGPFHKTFFNILRHFRHSYIDRDINLTYYAAHPITVVDRVRQEVKHGIPTADVVMLPHYATLKLKIEGYLREYYSDQNSSYPSTFKDEDAMWSAIAVEPTNAIYNRSIIKGELVPTRLEELANPDLRGKVAIQSVQDWSEGMYSYYYFAALLELIGEKKWDSVITEFLRNVEPTAFPCYHNMQKYVARGDFGIGLPLPLIKVSWSVATLNLEDVPDTASLRSIGIVAKGAHQNAAELFYDYLLSEQWQNKMGKDYEGLIPTRPGATMKYNAQFTNGTNGMTYFPDERGVREAFSKDSLLEKFKQIGLP